MKLIYYTIYDAQALVRPAPLEREWMDASPEKYAYRCLPLTIANTHGWELLCPRKFTAIWDGGNGLDAIKIIQETKDHAPPVSHFGSGILTLHTQGIFCTDDQTNLWVTGPVNRPKDAIYALSGVIETDWSPYTFTMNWQFTRPNVPVVFEEGEPFCMLFPLGRGDIEKVSPEIRHLSEHPELEKDFHLWQQQRNFFNKDLKVKDSESQREKWQRAYFKGLRPGGEKGAENHQSKLRVQPFKDFVKR